MNAYLVTYELKKAGKDYKPFFEELKTAPKWWHYIKDSWIIITDESLELWSGRLRPLIDANDFLLIIGINRKRHGQLPEKAWNWLRENVGAREL